ncbi:hypothetical protein DFH09DRAFT_1400528 [Mycena vulgaris]|nr:hypothetical protein DFH09DRAFT_1400528 [Mycena vulgaris]
MAGAKMPPLGALRVRNILQLTRRVCLVMLGFTGMIQYLGNQYTVAFSFDLAPLVSALRLSERVTRLLPHRFYRLLEFARGPDVTTDVHVEDSRGASRHHLVCTTSTLILFARDARPGLRHRFTHQTPAHPPLPSYFLLVGEHLPSPTVIAREASSAGSPARRAVTEYCAPPLRLGSHHVQISPRILLRPTPSSISPQLARPARVCMQMRQDSVPGLRVDAVLPSPATSGGAAMDSASASRGPRTWWESSHSRAFLPLAAPSPSRLPQDQIETSQCLCAFGPGDGDSATARFACTSPRVLEGVSWNRAQGRTREDPKRRPRFSS